MTYTFVRAPEEEDFRTLAGHLTVVPPARLHSSLWPLRDQVAARLRLMGREPEREAHRAAYHALRLLVW